MHVVSFLPLHHRTEVFLVPPSGVGSHKLIFANISVRINTLRLARLSAHDVRVLASSWSFFAGTSLQYIVAVVQWRSHSIFTLAYLRDMATEVEGM